MDRNGTAGVGAGQSTFATSVAEDPARRFAILDGRHDLRHPTDLEPIVEISPPRAANEQPATGPHVPLTAAFYHDV